MIEMKTLKLLDGTQYEIVDAKARKDIENMQTDLTVESITAETTEDNENSGYIFYTKGVAYSPFNKGTLSQENPYYSVLDKDGLTVIQGVWDENEELSYTKQLIATSNSIYLIQQNQKNATLTPVTTATPGNLQITNQETTNGSTVINLNSHIVIQNKVGTLNLSSNSLNISGTSPTMTISGSNSSLNVNGGPVIVQGGNISTTNQVVTPKVISYKGESAGVNINFITADSNTTIQGYKYDNSTGNTVEDSDNNYVFIPYLFSGSLSAGSAAVTGTLSAHSGYFNGATIGVSGLIVNGYATFNGSDIQIKETTNLHTNNIQTTTGSSIKINGNIDNYSFSIKTMDIHTSYLYSYDYNSGEDRGNIYVESTLWGGRYQIPYDGQAVFSNLNLKEYADDDTSNSITFDFIDNKSTSCNIKGEIGAIIDGESDTYLSLNDNFKIGHSEFIAQNEPFYFINNQLEGKTSSTDEENNTTIYTTNWYIDKDGNASFNSIILNGTEVNADNYLLKTGDTLEGILKIGFENFTLVDGGTEYQQDFYIDNTGNGRFNNLYIGGEKSGVSLAVSKVTENSTSKIAFDIYAATPLGINESGQLDNNGEQKTSSKLKASPTPLVLGWNYTDSTFNGTVTDGSGALVYAAEKRVSMTDGLGAAFGLEVGSVYLDGSLFRIGSQNTNFIADNILKGYSSIAATAEDDEDNYTWKIDSSDGTATFSKIYIGDKELSELYASKETTINATDDGEGNITLAFS